MTGSPEQVDRVVPGNAGEPASGVIWHAARGPGSHRLHEGILHGVLNEIEVTWPEPPGQR